MSEKGKIIIRKSKKGKWIFEVDNGKKQPMIIPSFYDLKDDSLNGKECEVEREKGKIVKATSNYTDRLNEILNIDENARYIGEFAISVNPAIDLPTGSILFDEKMKGSIHFTPGNEIWKKVMEMYQDCIGI